MRDQRFNGFTNLAPDNNNKTHVNNNPYSRSNRVTYADQVYDFNGFNGIDKESRDMVDSGLLALVDKSKVINDDPLASLIESLADLSNLSASSINKGHLNVNHVRHLAGTNNNGHAITDTNSTPNQSPKAWQFSVQVCLDHAFAYF